MKATHVGECQICGRTQMLPNGTLSNHGYTVRCGFFSGICSGAGHLPFEQSKDAIAPVVAAVMKNVELCAAEIALYRDLNSGLNAGNEAWFRVYVGRSYVWAKCDVAIHQNEGSEGYKWLSVTRSPAANEDRNNARQRVELYCFKFSTVREVVHHCNEKTAVLPRSHQRFPARLATMAGRPSSELGTEGVEAPKII